MMGFIAVTFLVLASFAPRAQAETKFTTTDSFTLPVQNGSIQFSVNGSYANANFDGSVWQFTDLKVGSFRSPNMQNLTASLQNCNITVLYYRTVVSNTTLGSISLRYTVQGDGIQIFNFGELPKDGIWSATINGNFIGPGKEWKIATDGTVTVSGANSNTNVTLIYYLLPGFLQDTYNQPFYLRHSVGIAAGAALAVTIAIGVVVWKWRQPRPAADSIAVKEAT
jgi:hypothetical protein